MKLSAVSGRLVPAVLPLCGWLAARTRARAALAPLRLGGVCFEEGKMAAADSAEPPGGSVRSGSDLTPLLSGSRPGTPPPSEDAPPRAEPPACRTRRPPGRRRADPDRARGRAGRRDCDSRKGECHGGFRVGTGPGPDRTGAAAARDELRGSFRQTGREFSQKKREQPLLRGLSALSTGGGSGPDGAAPGATRFRCRGFGTRENMSRLVRRCPDLNVARFRLCGAGSAAARQGLWFL